MRHVVGNRIGRTDFFRNPAFLSALVDLLTMERRPRVLVHAAAVGAEPYSLVMACHLAGLHDIRVEATDIEPSFLNIAQQGVYDDNCLDKVPDVARRFFLPGPKSGTVEVVPEIRARVTFLQPSSFVDFKASKDYNAVLALNALTYAATEEQRIAILHMGEYARSYLGLTAVSPSIIKNAVQDAGFVPVDREDWLRIYYGWRDRIRLRPGRREWALPVLPFLMHDWKFSASSLFCRRSSTTAAKPSESRWA